MRCATCTAGISKNFAKTESSCKVCGKPVNKCPTCVGVFSHSNTCADHTIRSHTCLSKCSNQCITKNIINAIPTNPNIKKAKKRKNCNEEAMKQCKIRF